MKILINTNYKSAGSTICADELGRRFKDRDFSVRRNDWKNYQDYDLILFMNPDSDVARAKKINPQAIVAIMDPKILRSKLENIQRADFLLVSSIEQRDIFLKYNKNIFIYYMFPKTEEVYKEHIKKDKIIIGYHGNKAHLDSMSEVNKALDRLSEKYNIELWAVYNIKQEGKWRLTPKKTAVRHIQWSEEAYKELTKCDIGIVPAKIALNRTLGLFCAKSLKRFLGYNFKYNKNDYLMRLKYSSNPGRLYIFSQFYIPVVADFFPSACQVIKDGQSGFLAWSEQGWENALEKLIQSPDLRNQMSRNLKQYIDANCSPAINFQSFLSFLNKTKPGLVSQ